MSQTTTDTEEMTVRETINQTLAEEMERDERVYIQGIDVAGRGGTSSVLKGLDD